MSEPSYPHRPGHKGVSDTGRAAAASFATKAKAVRQLTLEALERGPATAEQVARKLDKHFMIVRARCSVLRALGLIEDSGERGDGALGGRVVVWRLTTAEERGLFAARKAAAAEKNGGAR